MATNYPQGTSGSEIRHEASRLAGQAKDKAQDLASSAADLAGQARDKVEEVAGDVAHRASQAWDSTRQGAQAAYSAVSEKAEDAFDSVNGLVQRYPVPSLLVAFGLGFLVAQILHTGSDS